MGGIIPRTLKNEGDASPRPPCGGAPGWNEGIIETGGYNFLDTNLLGIF